LDGSKTGLTVLPKLHKMDSKYWQQCTPYWKKPAEEKAKIPEAEVAKLCQRRKPFIMDTISREAPKAGKRKLEEIQTFFSLSNGGVFDDDLAKPWLNAVKLAELLLAEESCDRWQRDLKKIADHVAAVFAQYQSLPPVARERIWLLSREFALRPPTDQLLMDKRDISRLKASCAYLYDAEKAEGGWSHFPWDMAMRELCGIKGVNGLLKLRVALTPWSCSERSWVIEDSRYELLRTVFREEVPKMIQVLMYITGGI
jgi:RNA-dependent RNA polymerase